MPTNPHLQDLKSPDPNETSSIDRYANLITRDCSEALKTYQKLNNFLYRGLHAPTNAFKSFPVEAREPKDTSLELHKDFNLLMRETGFKATRDNSIFCTSVRADTTQYGSAYLIFPFNGFEFSWSTHYADLTMELFGTSRNIDAVIKSVYELLEPMDYTQNAVTELTDALSNGEEEDGETLPLALQSIDFKQTFYDLFVRFYRELNAYGNLPEITTLEKVATALQQIETSNWHQGAVGVIQDNLPDLMRAANVIHDPEEAKTFMQLIGMTTRGFYEAIEAGHEISILGEYYAFRAERFEPALREILLTGMND